MYGDPYATVQDLEKRLGDKLDDGRYADLLDAASRAIEDFTGRQFNKDTSETPVATARKFKALDPSRLPVDDFHTDADLVINVDGTVWAVTDVELRPWNGIYKGMNGWPYSDLLAKSRRWPFKRYPVVTITAHWGWASVPEGIRQATLDVAEVISQGSGGLIRSETMGPYSVSYSVPSAGATVPSELTKAEPYRRISFGVG